MVNEDQFVPKELASYDSENHITHHVFQPSHSFSTLSTKYKNTANWLMIHHHCINWNVGFVPVCQFDYIIKYLCRNVKKVFVKGREKMKFLRSIVSVPIIELEENEGKLSMGAAMCGFHERRICMCALSNVNYLHSIVEKRLTTFEKERQSEVKCYKEETPFEATIVSVESRWSDY